MIILEDFTYNEINEIYKDVLDEFTDCEAFNDVFRPQRVSRGLGMLNKRNKTVLAQCRCHREFMETKFTIYFNPNMMQFGKDREDIIRSVFAHEILHTFKGCMNHGPEFHKWAQVIKRELGYVIDTKADEDASSYFQNLVKHRYMTKCQKCGNITYFDRTCDAVKNPGSYLCAVGSCDGKLDSYIFNDRTNEFELYRSADDSPEYNIEIKCPDCDWHIGYQRLTDKARQQLSYCLNGAKCPKCGATTYAMNNKEGYRILSMPKKPLKPITVKIHSRW